MREIKFRAWYRKKMTKSFDLDDFAEDHDGEYGSFDFPSQDSDAVFMQYTGLKDKNGLEIYEGDIVGRPYNPMVVEYGNWNCGECSDVYGYEFINGPHDGNDKTKMELEVLGNIYENPELLI